MYHVARGVCRVKCDGKMWAQGVVHVKGLKDVIYGMRFRKFGLYGSCISNNLIG